MATGTMEVTLLQARGLKNTEFFGKVDPYVLIQYKNQEQKSQTSRGKATKFRAYGCMCLRDIGCVHDVENASYAGQGSDPVWNEKFKFRVEYPIKGDEHPKLVLKIMDKDSFTEDDFVGQATINLKELFAIGVESGMAQLAPQKYRVVSSNQTYRGEIKVGVTFIALEGTDRLKDVTVSQ